MATDDSEHDALVARRVVQGHVNDYRILVERHQDRIVRFVRGLIGCRQEAEDITQEVFLAAYRYLASFDSSRAKFSTWLFTIARNRSINHQKGTRPVVVEQTHELIASHDRADGLEVDEFRAQLDRALHTLPFDQKTVFTLAEIEEIPLSEIAGVEQIPVGTVKSRLHRAKQRLREALKEFASG